jgi:hypothetical protein
VEARSRGHRDQHLVGEQGYERIERRCRVKSTSVRNGSATGARPRSCTLLYRLRRSCGNGMEGRPHREVRPVKSGGKPLKAPKAHGRYRHETRPEGMQGGARRQEVEKT